MGYMKGQGATEYLVLLAVVLIIALVSIALLGFFPGMASDAKITQSASYWRGEARPFAILENSITNAGLVSVVIQNNDAASTLKITTMTVGGFAMNGTGNLPLSIAPGETKTVTSTSGTALPGGVGSVYDLAVVINYDSVSSGLTGLKQTGSKNIMGKYS